METFNINKIVEYYKPNVDELGQVLFPHVKYPKQAFDRVLKGEANLDTHQVELLAKYLGVFVSDLFSVNSWKGGWNEDCKCLTLTKGPYQVNLNYNGFFVTVYKDGKVVHQEVNGLTDSMPMSEFIKYIDSLLTTITD